MNIKNKVAYLTKKYHTYDPFEIASALGILVIFEELGTIRGYYNRPYRIKQIHINSNLIEPIKKFTCAHEIGHAILHPNANTPFLQKNTFLSIDRMELEANSFAAQLLIPDEIILENQDKTTEQLACLLGYEQALVELRLKAYFFKLTC